MVCHTVFITITRARNNMLVILTGEKDNSLFISQVKLQFYLILTYFMSKNDITMPIWHQTGLLLGNQCVMLMSASWCMCDVDERPLVYTDLWVCDVDEAGVVNVYDLISHLQSDLISQGTWLHRFNKDAWPFGRPTTYTENNK